MWAPVRALRGSAGRCRVSRRRNPQGGRSRRRRSSRPSGPLVRTRQNRSLPARGVCPDMRWSTWRCPPRNPPHHRSRSITCSTDTQKSMSAGVDIGLWHGYGFSRSSERQKGLAETNCRPVVQVVAVSRTVRRRSFEARAFVGRRRDWRPDRVARSDQGPPQAGPRSWQVRYPWMQCAAPSSEVSERYPW
jgi:hypothetical protein